MIRRLNGPRLAAAACLFTALVASGPAARAQDEAPAAPRPPERLLLLGAGVYATSNPYESAREEADGGFLPLFVYQDRFVRADLSGLAINTYANDRFELVTRIAPRFQFIDPKETRDFSFLDRDMGVDLGVRLGSAIGPARVSLEYLADVSGETEGQELTLDATVEATPIDRLSVEAVASLSWKDEALATWLYGVRQSEAGPGRAYEFGRSPGAPSGGVWVPSFGVQMRYQINDRVFVLAATEVEVFGDDITDSPLMAKDFTVAGFVALVRRF